MNPTSNNPFEPTGMSTAFIRHVGGLVSGCPAALYFGRHAASIDDALPVNKDEL